MLEFNYRTFKLIPINQPWNLQILSNYTCTSNLDILVSHFLRNES